MNDPVRFLNGFAQALAVMTLYPEGHPSRERLDKREAGDNPAILSGGNGLGTHLSRLLNHRMEQRLARVCGSPVLPVGAHYRN